MIRTKPQSNIVLSMLDRMRKPAQRQGKKELIAKPRTALRGNIDQYETAVNDLRMTMNRFSQPELQTLPVESKMGLKIAKTSKTLRKI